MTVGNTQYLVSKLLLRLLAAKAIPMSLIVPNRALPGLLTPSAAYKPFRYPWAFDMWKKQQQVHWMPEEVPLGDNHVEYWRLQSVNHGTV